MPMGEVYGRLSVSGNSSAFGFLLQATPTFKVAYSEAGVALVIGFSQLSSSEFLTREMETCETENHLLCGWVISAYSTNHLSVQL